MKTKIILVALSFFFAPTFVFASVINIVSNENTTASFPLNPVLRSRIAGADWQNYSSMSVFNPSQSGTPAYLSMTFRHTEGGMVYVRIQDMTNGWTLSAEGSASVPASTQFSTVSFNLTSYADLVFGHGYIVTTCSDSTFATCTIYGNNSSGVIQYVSGGTGSWDSSLFTGYISTGENQSSL